MREAFAVRLKKALEDNLMNPDILIIKTGLSKSKIDRYLAGTHIPEQKKLSMIAKVLNVRSAWLLGCDVGGEIEDMHTYSSADLTAEEFEDIWNFAVNLKKEMKDKK